MNKLEIIGRLTRNPELKQTSNNLAYARFNVAVDRRMKSKDGTRQADFIPCVAWRQAAEFVCKYFRQGSKIALVGSMQSSSYQDKNGQNRSMLNMLVEEIYFCESSSNDNNGNGQHSQPRTSNNNSNANANNNVNSNANSNYFNSDDSEFFISDDSQLPFGL